MRSQPGSDRLFDRLSRLGVGPGLDARSAKRVILSNKTALGICMLAIIVGAVYAALGIEEVALACWTGALGYGLVPVIARTGRLTLSRLFHVGFTNVVVFALCWYFGRESGFYFHFLSPVLVSLLVMGTHERKPMLMSFVLTATCLSALIGMAAVGIERHPLPQRTAEILFFCNLFAAMIINAFRIWSFYTGTMETEKALGEAVDAARAADKAKSRFLANMSHEIRTPLNGILGLSDVLVRSELGVGQRESVESIRSSAFDLLGIINEILDLSKIEAGKMRLEYTAFELRRLVDSMRRLYLPQAARKGLRFSVEVAPDVPDRLVGDPVRLKQVINNLAGNAIKFTESGGVSLRVRPARAAENIVPLEFEVEDSGVGIPQEAQGRLFHAFSQADAATSRKYGGTGLGLHLCRQMVEMMGGEIGFESTVGRGSRFFFRLPFSFAPGGAAMDDDFEHAFDWEPGTALAGLRILLVDDHPINRRVLEAMLESHGARPVQAGDGIEALKAFSQQNFDLVLMDSQMPNMDGFECTRRMRQKAGRPQGDEVRKPIIIGVTADAMPGSREKCLEAGMDEMITKPILEKDFFTLLARWFGTGRLGDSMRVSERPPQPYATETATEWVDANQLGEMNAWIRQYNPGYWNKTLGQFDSSFQRLSGAIREACAAGRFHEAGESAHALRGVCVMLGMRRMADTCLGLEALGLGGDTGDWADMLEHLEAEREPTLVELRRWIK